MRRRRTGWVFQSVRTEGAVLPRELLEKVAALDPSIPGLTPKDYGLLEHERIGDAASRSWTRLLGCWAAFKDAVAKLGENEPATRVTRERWLLPLFQELGYGRIQAAKSSFEVEGRAYAVSHSWGNSPIHLLGSRTGLDKRESGVAGAASSSAHGLVQDFLNRSDPHLWGFVSNGLVLRVLRDNHSLTRQAYVEFDLQAIMDGEEYAEFLLLWLVCHASRVEVADPGKPGECWLEKWFEHARDQGVQALDDLRLGVEQALRALGAGFLKCRANAALHQALSDGTLDGAGYFRELLRLAYRLIFLFVTEDRGLLLDPEAPSEAKDRYRRYYGTERLRDLALRRRGSAHVDLWRGLRLVMGKLQAGCPELGLPALGSHLWDDDTVRNLVTADIANEDLLAAVRSLCSVVQGGSRRIVNWRTIGAQELGSVYESLLEYHPRIERESGGFSLEVAAGHERKTTGSYYTPDSLVNCLLDSALDPVLDEAARKADPERAILDLKVCDPACGSGHFLVAAAHRIAKRLAQVRSGDAEPSPKETRRALRNVVGRCLFGVDINPMAVELCKVSLWLEGYESGRPLSFLDAHIQCGNSLLGTTPALMAKGIPEEAFEAIEGDDKKIASALKKQNRAERRSGQTTLFAALSGGASSSSRGDVAREVAGFEAAADDDIEGLHRKEAAWAQLEQSAALRDERFLADAWCAAFVWRKTPEMKELAITEGLWQRMQQDVTAAPAETRKEVRCLAQHYRFFHWHLAFPQVFRVPSGAETPSDEMCGWAGGFDVVLGNPPWEHVEIKEQEWFAQRSPKIAGAANAAVRKRMIDALRGDDPELHAAFLEDLRETDGENALVRQSGRFRLCSKGRINTYAVFAEHNRAILSPRGWAGFIVPTGIATDDTTKDYFSAIVDGHELARFYSFENEEFVFPAVHHAFKFALIAIDRSGQRSRADLVFFARQVAALDDAERHFSLSAAEFALLNPNTKTCPTFRTRRDAELNLAIYRQTGVLWREHAVDGNPWGLRFTQGIFNMASDSGLFRTRAELERLGGTLIGNVVESSFGKSVPLVEAKMVHHFDHRFGTYEGQSVGQANQGKLPELDDVAHADPNRLTLPDYWVAASEVQARIGDRWQREWLLGWRDICRSTDQRTVIASLIPAAGTGDTFLVAMPAIAPALAGALYANLCAFVLDYAARQKVGGTHLKYHVFKQLPILPPTDYGVPCPWRRCDSVGVWILCRVLELAYTSWDLEPFARDVGCNEPPFRWDSNRRFLLRTELDAAFFHLYRIARDDAAYILDTFPVVRKNDEKAHGTYRTKDKILEVYDALQRAIDTGSPYQTVLDPPPADPRVAHSGSRGAPHT